MRRRVPLLGAVVVLGLLVLVTVLSAGSVDSSALGHAVQVAPLPGGSATPPAPVSCAVTPGSSAQVTVGGACRGSLAGELTCTGDEDALNVSLQAPVAGGRRLTISVILPDPSGPGRYDEAAVYAQLSRSGGAERWSNRATTVTLTPKGVFTVAASLKSDVATGTPGRISLRGSMHCSKATADVLDDLG